MIENDTWYRCNVCGREGRVGRCCSDEDRTPLNALAKAKMNLGGYKQWILYSEYRIIISKKDLRGLNWIKLSNGAGFR